jgi:hypothetical protein
MGAAIATIIHQFVALGWIYRQVEHVIASIAELHGCILYVGIIGFDTKHISNRFNFGRCGAGSVRRYIYPCVI